MPESVKDKMAKKRNKNRTKAFLFWNEDDTHIVYCLCPKGTTKIGDAQPFSIEESQQYREAIPDINSIALVDVKYEKSYGPMSYAKFVVERVFTPMGINAIGDLEPVSAQSFIMQCFDNGELDIGKVLNKIALSDSHKPITNE